MPIVNKHFGLCGECNNIRLHGNKWGKQTPHKEKKKKEPAKKSLFVDLAKGNSKTAYIIGGGRHTGKSLAMYVMDNVFYKQSFDRSDHKCEECGIQLNEQFEDDNGKVLNRSRYSHIVPKSIAPELRHVLDNINHLCLKDHMEWENGDKKAMKIYKKNKLRWPNHIK